jgi:hypothetical protein
MEAKWLGSTVSYEGQSMALRIRVGADVVAIRSQYPVLIALTHKLAAVLSSGLPEPSYNNQLLELDLAIVSALDADGRGITALIETFSGKRTYYAYAEAKEQGEAAVEQVRHLHPGHFLSVTTRPDTAWELLETYRRLFPW